jgi:hypothetical protein
VVTPSFGDESLPVAAGTVMLDALYANPLRQLIQLVAMLTLQSGRAENYYCG